MISTISIISTRQASENTRRDRQNMGGFGRTPVVVKPEGPHDQFLVFVFAVLNGLVVPKNLKDYGFDFGDCTDDSAHVGYYESVD